MSSLRQNTCDAGDRAPLIVTLALDEAAQRHFDLMRERYFPPERNFIPAHLSLFHALPGAEEASILATLGEAARQPPLLLHVTGLMRLGRGVAYAIDSSPLMKLHRGLQQTWQTWLTPQDRQGIRPHIVIQNKAEPQAARALYAELAAAFTPFSCTGTGLRLWRYLGGPWEAVHTVPFA